MSYHDCLLLRHSMKGRMFFNFEAPHACCALVEVIHNHIGSRCSAHEALVVPLQASNIERQDK